MPEVSVVMSVYNTKEEFLRRTIESVLEQNFDGFEFIIINDGATDGSPKILEEYAEKDSRIIVKHQANMGLTKALNVGLRMSRGRYIARQDSSDVSHADRILRQYEFLEDRPGTVVCWTWYDVIDTGGNIIGRFEFPTGNRAIIRKLLRANVFAHTTAFFRRKEVIEIGGYREVFTASQDKDLWLRLIEKYRVGAIGENLALYRFEKDSISIAENSVQPFYGKMAIGCYRARKKTGNDREFIERFLENSNRPKGRKYSKERLFLANLYLRSGMNHEARQLFSFEIKKGYNLKLTVKWLMSALGIDWSPIYRIL